MTIREIAEHYSLWQDLRQVICNKARNNGLLKQIADLPVRPSHSATRLGSYLSRGGRPVCVRLQFAQERSLLIETLMHEVAHACDHLDNQPGKSYRKPHASGWQDWMAAFGLAANSRGQSEQLADIYRQRLKVVAVCSVCGAEIRRLRRLNRRRRYLHANCGGALHPL